MPPARRQRLGAEQRRETILRAAAEVFAVHGYRAGKVADVAAAVGVTEPVVFQNFGSKAALYAAVIERAAAELSANLEAMTEQHGSVADLLAHVVGAAGAKGRTPPFHAVLFTDAVSLAAEPALKEPARHALRAVAQHLADLVRRGQADGDVDRAVDPEAAAWMVLSVLAGRTARAATMPRRPRLEEAVSALALRALGIDRPASALEGLADHVRFM